MKQIPLSQGQLATVDDCDYDWAMQWKWSFCSGYAVRKPPAPQPKVSIFLHVQIAKRNGLSGEYFDHKDRNRLNDTRDNIRAASKSQDAANRQKPKRKLGSTSRYKGVSWDSSRSKWFAKIQVSRKQVPLGRFNTEEEGAEAYSAASKKYFGEFAWSDL